MCMHRRIMPIGEVNAVGLYLVWHEQCCDCGEIFRYSYAMGQQDPEEQEEVKEQEKPE